MNEVLDGVSEALKEAVGVWSSVQAIKTQQMLTKAQISAMYAGAPYEYQNPQAKATQTTEVPGVGSFTGTGMLLAFAVFGVAVYLAVK